MDTYRKTAIIVGVLFITATVTAILSLLTLGSTLDPPDYLTTIPDNEIKVVLAVIFELILAIAVTGIGVMLYPILKKQKENLALSYVGLRLIESILIIIAFCSLLALLTMSQEYGAGSMDAAYYLPVGSALLALREWSFVIGTMVFLGLGGLPLYYLLYKGNLVPSALSIWGLIGATCVLLYGLLGVAGFDTNNVVINLLAAPIAIQEMVFAVWLIIKGFNQQIT